MRRRTLLSGIGAATAAGVLAGCLGDGSGGDTDDDTDDSTGDDATGDEGVSEPAEIETLGQSEVGEAGDDLTERYVDTEASVTLEDDTITVEGSLEAPTPCHEAVVESVDEDGDELVVTVTVEEDQDGDVCAQQIAEIEYEATIEPSEGTPSTVTVLHVDRLDEETVAEETIE